MSPYFRNNPYPEAVSSSGKSSLGTAPLSKANGTADLQATNAQRPKFTRLRLLSATKSPLRKAYLRKWASCLSKDSGAQERLREFDPRPR